MEPEATTGALLAALSSARPELEAELASPTTPKAIELRESILTQPARSVTPHPRVHWEVPAAAAAAVAIALGAVAIAVDPPGSGRLAHNREAQAARNLSPGSIRHIAAVSTTTLSGTGRADVAFRVGSGSLSEQTGSGTVTFAGDDLEMVFRFAGREGRPGFEAMNRTVDGHFYLLDGPPHEKRWYIDTNAPGSRGADLFTVDPRTIVSAIHPDVEFDLAGSEDAGGVALRHLRAARPGRLPALNLGLGPIETTTIESFDIWVDDADVVRRLDLTTASVETVPASASKVVAEDGATTVVSSADMKTVEHRASYSVSFYAIGEPIEIEAPAEAIPVAGQG